MRKGQEPAGVVRVDQASSASAFRKLDDAFLQICQILGLAGIDLFTPSDVVEKKNVRKVPDFDIVTSTVSMPNYIVGGIRRTLEQPQYSSSSSSGYSPCANYKALQQQASSWKALTIIFGGQDDQNGDTHYDSDEAESRLSVLKPEELVDEDNFTEMLLQLSDAPKERNQVYGENGLDTHDVKSQAESVGSLNLGGLDSDSVDSTPLLHSKESCCLTQSATDRCSRTRTTKCSLSSEESNSISSCLALAFDNGMNDLELEDPLAAISELIHDGDVQLRFYLEIFA
ncbi:hypothetical protein PR202_gb11264 [Eleusine coracana subsp. coracana]|uniref:Uncharacterized protein n=1 Tax=Eleusine coracana subsp. coracana TaxID=191504 RepID=A0AAV5ELN7_ELECO|nr:hypothetical protein PR202_gb11264 [Eleusine coracana subsp. coracana]